MTATLSNGGILSVTTHSCHGQEFLRSLTLLARWAGRYTCLRPNCWILVEPSSVCSSRSQVRAILRSNFRLVRARQLAAPHRGALRSAGLRPAAAAAVRHLEITFENQSRRASVSTRRTEAPVRRSF